MSLISSILIGALGGIAMVLLLNAFDNKKHNVKTSEKNLGRIPSRDEAKLFLVKKIRRRLLFISSLKLLKSILIKKVLFLA